MDKRFCFTVDDNIRVFKELTKGEYSSIFDHPYLAMYRRLHKKHGLCVQLNLFYEGKEGFTLAEMTDRYCAEFEANADWLKMSFHSRMENVRPYENSGYDEVLFDATAVETEIVRFASKSALAETTTVHFCRLTADGIRAMAERRVRGLLGLYGDKDSPRLSYQTKEMDAPRLREGETVYDGKIAYAGIDIVLNLYETKENLARLAPLCGRDLIKVMIHEQYFYPDYPHYQKDFEEKLDAVFTALTGHGYQSTFFENTLKKEEL